jgi:Cof subfamily protein (haloacid dehalogenase superfamily)
MADRPLVIATDLDGTIVRSDGTISERTSAALAHAQSLGVLVVVVTGRPPRWLQGIAEGTGQSGLAICANGALTTDLATGEIVEAIPIEPAVVRTVISALRPAIDGVSFAVETIDGTYVHEEAYRPAWLPDKQVIVKDLLLAETAPVAKLLARHTEVSSDELLATARRVLPEGLASPTHSSIDGLLEINGFGTSKASTLSRFLAARGFTASDVIAFGDMPNDVEMLTWAGHSVAVANAHAEVLAVVDEVTESNDNDGVALVLERLYP